MKRVVILSMDGGDWACMEQEDGSLELVPYADPEWAELQAKRAAARRRAKAWTTREVKPEGMSWREWFRRGGCYPLFKDPETGVRYVPVRHVERRSGGSSRTGGVRNGNNARSVSSAEIKDLFAFFSL